jgi:hypothetical protein
MENLKNLIETHTCNMGGIRSGSSKSKLINLVPTLLSEKKITIATTSKEIAENIVAEIFRYGLTVDFKHVYEKRKYKHTIVSLKNK